MDLNILMHCNLLAAKSMSVSSLLIRLRGLLNAMAFGSVIGVPRPFILGKCVYYSMLDYPNGNGFFPSLRCKVCSSDTVEVSFLPSYKFLTPFIFIMNAVGEEQNDLSC